MEKDITTNSQEMPVQQKAFVTVPDEDAAQLHALVSQSLGLKGQQPVQEELPDPSTINPISVDQIKGMRKAALSQKTHTEPLSKVFYEGLIKLYFDIKDSFKPSVRARQCAIEGHECIHCGQKIPVAQASGKEKKEKPAPPPATATPSAQEHSE